VTPELAAEAARVLWELWSGGRVADGLPDQLRPRSVDEGWEIQRALDALAGPPVGWKIAATSSPGQRHIGATGPLVGRLYERCMVPSGASLDASTMTMRSLEAEFAFRIAIDVPRPLSPEELPEQIAHLVPAIEVPDTRFADFTAVGLPSLVADAMCDGHVVTGEPTGSWDPAALAAHAVTLRRYGDVVASGSGAAVLGDPLLALAWLSEELHRRGQLLRAGDLVITGAATPPHRLASGERFTADFGGLGAVSVAFT
jgi:2-keto-4-pentenoate hydratase